MDNIVINDRYILRNTIGHGGFSVVYSAFDKVLNKDVAIKLLKIDIDKSPEKYAMFRQEAITLASLSNQNIVKVYESNVYENHPFLVMDYVNGKSLKTIIHEQSYLLVEEVYLYLQQILNGLEAMHNANIIHRDIKPLNIVKKADGTLVLIDFGTAMIQDEEMNVYKDDGKNIIGTLQFMAPELLTFPPNREAITCQSDIYALGISVFEMFTGKLPFDSTEKDYKRIIVGMHLNATFPSVRTFNPDVPVEFENIIYKCCEKDVKKRYKNVNEIRVDLINAYEAYKNPSKKKQSLLSRLFKRKEK